MKPRPRLTELQKAKAIAMARDGSTHAEIAALLHVPLGSIRTVLTEWLKDNLPELQKHLRAFIDASLSNGKQSMILPKMSRLVSRPVLADYATRYTITTRERLGCTWHLFTPNGTVSTPRNYSSSMAIEQMAHAKRYKSEADAHASGLCVKCLKRPHIKRGYKCAECIAYLRNSTLGKSCT